MGMGGTRPLRIAFVGSGNMAGLHLAALARVPTAHQLVGVHDVRLEAARAFAQRAGTEAFGSLPAMLAAARPDVVHVCTTAGTHFEPARQALLAAAHVYVEKPFVETQVEADRIVAATASALRADGGLLSSEERKHIDDAISNVKSARNGADHQEQGDDC